MIETKELIWNFYNTLVELVLPEYLPEQLYFLRIFAWFYSAITMVLITLSPLIIMYTFYKNRRFG